MLFYNTEGVVTEVDRHSCWTFEKRSEKECHYGKKTALWEFGQVIAVWIYLWYTTFFQDDNNEEDSFSLLANLQRVAAFNKYVDGFMSPITWRVFSSVWVISPEQGWFYLWII